MKIYMIRHGETDWNKARKLQGQIDIQLNEFGRSLAVDTEPALRDIPFDLVITSPLSRAKVTAQLVLAGRDIPMIEDERIMEMGFGAYEGLHCKGENYNIPDPDFHYFYDSPSKFKAPEGGEDFYALSARLDEFLNDLLNNSELQDKTILISTHGASLCGILRLMKGWPMDKFWGDGVHKNCAVSLAEYKEGKIDVLWENVTYYKAEVENW